MKKSALLILLVFSDVALSADTVVEEIIVRINDKIVTRSQLERSRQQLRNEVQQQFPQNADKELTEREQHIVRDLIDQELLLQRGAHLGITADAEVIKRLDEMRKQMKLESMEALQQAAEQQGVDWEEYKQGLRENIITQMVISREVGSRVQITKEETQKYYEENQERLQQPEQVRLSEILVSTTPPEGQPQQQEAQEAQPTDPAKLAEAEAKARELLEQIRKGATFEEVAKQHSQGASAAEGGDIGYFRRGMLAKELEDLTFDKLKVGEVSDVIRTRQGYILLKVSAHQQPGVPPLKDIEPRIQEAIYMEKLRPSLRTYLTKLREDAYIDIKDGYVDTGASPNQTKPVITAAATEEEKPKKKKKRFLFF